MSALSSARVVTEEELQERLGPAAEPDVQRWRATLEWVRAQHAQAFREHAEAAELIAEYTHIIDTVLCRAWEALSPDPACALMAVGGYGRGELLPYSDIDVLILTPEAISDATRAALERFISLCWDCGLELGHSVRNLDECATEAAADITVVTNLMEARHLCGCSQASAGLAEAVGPDRCWPPQAFFEAKRAEQQTRYRRFDDSAYKLEPNVKEGPGGLRDLQTILWLAQRLHGTRRLEDLATSGLLTVAEVSDLRNGRNQLWRVRFALHMLSGRREDRLLFDHQVRLAEVYGYADQAANLAVEQFMQLYYRTIKMLSVLNDIFLQLFEEQLAGGTAETQAIDEDFAIAGHYLIVRHDDAFRNNPLNLLRIFRVWAENEQRRGIRGLAAEALRMLRRDRNLIDAGFRARGEAREMFMDILRMERGVLHSLRRMNRYGILGRYLPAFGRVIGRMQYDLFHQLTVDEHTLFVVRNLRRLAVPEFRHELPEFSELYARLPKPELLTLAGLFHDIAKGRGGDHSELGADDAISFCREHGLSTTDQQTVAWLVRNHLLMSLTAQREDVSDPDVVNAFVAKLPDADHLDYLYLLTVCDIRATNPKLWNGFKAGLLRSLYIAAQRSLREGAPLKEADLLAQRLAESQALCEEVGLADEPFQAVWSRLDPEHLLRHSADELAWQVGVLHNAAEETSVAVRLMPQRGTVVFLHAPDVPGLFAVCTGILAQLGLNILDARISATRDGWTADTYAIAETDGSDIADPARRSEIRNALLQALQASKPASPKVSRRLSARERHFDTPTQIFFRNDSQGRYTIMEMVANDRPGLLSRVGEVLRQHGLNLRSAKVGTIGERAEDLFHLTDTQGRPLSDPALFNTLREDLSRAIAQI